MILPLDQKTLAVAQTAACLWEAVLNGPGWEGDEHGGMCELREKVCRLAPYADKAWEIAHLVGYDAPFDWEFCPAFLSRCVDWETCTMKPDWPETAIKIGRDK